MRILYIQLLVNSCADSEFPVARGNLCGYLGSPVAWCTEFRFEGRGQLCSQASSVTYLIGKVWTSWYGHKKEERPYGYLVSSSMLGTLSPFARSRPWFRLSSVGAQGAGTHSLGVWNTLFFAAAQENSWLGYRLGHLLGAHPPRRNQSDELRRLGPVLAGPG